MIKSIAMIRLLHPAEDFERLASFLEALGLERGMSHTEFTGPMIPFHARWEPTPSARPRVQRESGSPILLSIPRRDQERRAQTSAPEDE